MEKTTTKEAKVTSKTPQEPQFKETKYCSLKQSVKMDDKDKDTGYTYAFEKIFVKELKRDEIRLCLYKDMRDRSGLISNRMLVRPVDLTEMEFLKILEKAIKEGLFTNEFLKYLQNIVNQK